MDEAAFQSRVRVIDSHTGGEPTRLVIDGGPRLTGSAAECLQQLRDHHDRFRRAVILEPRGSDVLVGAVLLPSAHAQCIAGAVFFNNVGYLGMCGHGTIGVIATLAWLGRIGAGKHCLETPVGIVETELHADGEVSVRNVASYRTQRAVEVEVAGHGRVTGDVAWGGNWFFLTGDAPCPVDLDHVRELTAFTEALRLALARAGVVGAGGAAIDHVEVISAAHSPSNHARNFVLCPGGAYDRSPCGTGTSAKLACLYADGRLAAGEPWRQESVTGSVFAGSFEVATHPAVLPTIRGSAWVTAEATLLFEPGDPSYR